MSQSTPQGIPVRRILLNHLSELPHGYGTTPGGTFFSTTPGGTRIIYDRSFLLRCRSSPMANTPPVNLPDIPGVTSPDKSPGKICTKIVEEEEPTSKDHGGRACLSNSTSGYDPYMSMKSPLQQYRQRSIYQEKTAHERKVHEDNNVQRREENLEWNHLRALSCQPVAEGGRPEASSSVLLASNKKAYPNSQLSAWRETKSLQTSQSVVGSSDSHRQSEMSAGQSELSIYRNKTRSHTKGDCQGNLCDSLEMLHKTYSSGNFFPFPPHNNPAYMSYTPAYGQYNFGNQAGKSYDSNANLIQ